VVTDNETNLLYISDQLPLKHPDFYSRFIDLLEQQNISYNLLPNTKDVWAVDYMPIQIAEDRFVQFKYAPDYLQTPKWRKTITDVDSVCEALNIKPIKSNIILDGGNIVRHTNKVIMCDKVFKENPTYSRDELITELKELFEIDKLYFIPQQPHDFTGHADGMVRFIDNETVLVNDYSKEPTVFKRSFERALHNSDLNYIELTYNPYRNAKHIQANGIYINYLQMEGTIIVPTFNIKEDDYALITLEHIFPGQKIIPIESNEIAKQGGILNCISWNIYSPQ
jgi:agmatine deiminase